ncbi:MAG TPA: BBP7 family outer membrane beta-barrel protein, partial [Gemmataceae bacterium]|nr:BBP7 family outer membrane beta-barrel protein [Gemmataceae bacterium]
AQLRQASFSSGWSSSNSTVARGKAPDSPLPMPLGDPVKGPTILDVPAGKAPTSDTPPAGSTITGPPIVDPVLPGITGSPILGDSGICCDGGTCCTGSSCCVPCDGCCPTCCDGCGEAYCWWVRPEVLLWTTKTDVTPPLVTTGPQASLGALGQPGTVVLFGGDINQGLFVGGRLTAGMWLDPEMEWGIEGSVFGLGQRTVNFGASSTGEPVLARPIFSPTGAAGVEQIANLQEVINGVTVLPTFGSVAVRETSRLWGGNTDLIFGLCRGDWGRLDLIGGFRYLNLRDDLSINENVTIAATSPVSPGVNFLVTDAFGTRNQFYGGDIGLRSELYWGNWQLDVTGKVALGNTHEVVTINGVTGITPPGVPTTFFQGGLLALPSNIGRYSRNRFAVAPEVGINLGYQLTPHWRIFGGWNFLYWSHVVRPGNAIDTVVNPTQVPRFGGSAATLVGAARPAFTFNDSSFWAQGANIGIEFRY